jgi:hypothetical protein
MAVSSTNASVSGSKMSGLTGLYIAAVMASVCLLVAAGSVQAAPRRRLQGRRAVQVDGIENPC